MASIAARVTLAAIRDLDRLVARVDLDGCRAREVVVHDVVVHAAREAAEPGVVASTTTIGVIGPGFTSLPIRCWPSLRAFTGGGL